MTNKAFYDGEMETLRLAIIDCIHKQMEFMNAQSVYLVLHPLTEEFRIMYQTDLSEQFRDRIQGRDEVSNDTPTSPTSGDSSSV